MLSIFSTSGPPHSLTRTDLAAAIARIPENSLVLDDTLIVDSAFTVVWRDPHNSVVAVQSIRLRPVRWLQSAQAVAARFSLC